MATLKPTLADPQYENWVKAGLALLFTREGIEQFVNDEVTKVHLDILNKVWQVTGLPVGITCQACTTENVTGRGFNCPVGICHEIRTVIENCHRFKPTYKNTHAKLWCRNPWEIAKCFMAPGYFSVATASDTDLPGLISVVINLRDFQTVINDNLSNQNNIFCQARKSRNTILHSATFKITDQDLISCIDDMTAVLSDGHTLANDQHAQDAKNKLNQIKTGTITVTEEDVKKVRDEVLYAIKEKEEEALLHIHEVVNEQKKQIRQVGQDTSANNKEQFEILYERQTENKSEQKHDQDKRKYDQDKQDLKRKLIEVYEKKVVNVPISPLMADEDNMCTITDLYAEPNMEIVKQQKTENKENKEMVTSDHDIFHDKDSHLCKNIYIVGNAGIGKSALCQNIVASWCKAHSQPENSPTASLSEHQQTMIKFDFLFYIPLREALIYSSVEEMIKDILLQQKHHPLLSRVLEDDSLQSLIILDGLDEWTAPTNYQPLPFLTAGLPNRKITNNCSILTTSRPWKLDSLRIKSSDIDRKIKMTGLNEDSSEILLKKAVAVLNEKHKSTKDAKSESGFIRFFQKRNLNHLRFIPVMLIQLICLWHDGRDIGDTKCQIYSSMIDLQFKLAKKKSVADKQLFKEMEEEQTKAQFKLPKCFYRQNHCLKFVNLLCSIGKMAFEALLNTTRESSLMFDSKTAKRYGLSKKELHFCFKVGILSQTNLIKGSTLRLKSFSFLHKSFQEFFAALYISISRDNADQHLQHMFRICCNIDVTLEMKDLFVFTSGMKPQFAELLSEHICNMGSQNSELQQYRQSTDFTVLSYDTELVQEVIVECAWESSKTNLRIDDAIICLKSEQHQKLLMNKNMANIKSLHISMYDYNDYAAKILRCSESPLMENQVMQKLKVYFVDFTPCRTNTAKPVQRVNTVITLHIVNMCSKTLQSLDLDTTTSLPLPTMLEDLCQLKAIALKSVKLSHDGYTMLLKFLSQRTQLRHIELMHIHVCVTTDMLNELYHLDLSKHQQLQSLYVIMDPAHNVHVNITNLVGCAVKCNTNTSFFHTVAFSPEARNKLTTTVSTTPLPLKYINLSDIDFSNKPLQLFPEMINLEDFALTSVTMTSEEFRCFVDSIPNVHKPAEVSLWSININPARQPLVINNIVDEQQQARRISAALDYIKSSPRFKVPVKRVDKHLMPHLFNLTFTVKPNNEDR